MECIIRFYPLNSNCSNRCRYSIFYDFRYFKIDKRIVYIFMIGITLALILMPKSFLFLLDYLPVGSKYSNLYALNLYTTEGNVWIAPLLVNTLIAAYLIFDIVKVQQ